MNNTTRVPNTMLNFRKSQKANFKKTSRQKERQNLFTENKLNKRIENVTINKKNKIQYSSTYHT